MSRTQVTEYKGHKIIRLDFSGLQKEEEIVAIIEQSIPIIRNNPPKSIFTLTNVSGMHFNNKIKDHFTNFTKGNKEHVKAGAVLGVSGLVGILLNGINKITGRKLKAFSDEQTARDWLITQN